MHAFIWRLYTLQSYRSRDTNTPSETDRLRELEQLVERLTRHVEDVERLRELEAQRLAVCCASRVFRVAVRTSGVALHMHIHIHMHMHMCVYIHENAYIPSLLQCAAPVLQCAAPVLQCAAPLLINI